MDTAFLLLPAERPYRIIVQNNPINFRDPYGLYNEDVHFHKTYAWAIEEGLEHHIALAISTANQAMDENYHTNPHHILGILFGGIWRHFQYRGNTELELTQCAKMRMVKRFGEGLHSLQDSFSHIGGGVFAHANKGTAPDDYSEENPRDKAMEQATRYWLREFKKSLEIGPFK